MISPVKLWRRQKDIQQFLGKTGTVVTWTKIIVATEAFKRYAPYPVVLVELRGGARAYGQLVDFDEDDLRIGQKVRCVLRKVRQPTQDGVIAYGIKFKPL